MPRQKLRGGSVRMSLELDDLSPVPPGSRISLKLKVVTDLQIELLNMTVSMKAWGSNVLNNYRDSRGTHAQVKWKEVYLLPTVVHSHNFENMEDLHHDRDDRTKSSFIHPFEVVLPNTLPDSWVVCDKQATALVTNRLMADVSYIRKLKGSKELNAHGEEKERSIHIPVDLNIRNDVAVEHFCRHAPVFHVEEALVDSCAFFQRSTVTARISLRDQAALIGQDLPVEVEIRNGVNRATRKVTLTLYKEYKLRNSDPESQSMEDFFVRKTLRRVKLPNVPPQGSWDRFIRGFTVPETCDTSGSVHMCSFARLRFLLKLKVKVWPIGMLKTEVELFIGSKQTQEATMEESLKEPYSVTIPGLPGPSGHNDLTGRSGATPVLEAATVSHTLSAGPDSAGPDISERE